MYMQYNCVYYCDTWYTPARPTGETSGPDASRFTLFLLFMRFMLSMLYLLSLSLFVPRLILPALLRSFCSFCSFGLKIHFFLSPSAQH
jgi:hypothetical protein